MSTLVVIQESRNAWELPLTTPLDEVTWQVWMATGRSHDRRSSAARMRAAKWVSTVTLLAAAALWSQVAPYEVLVRFIVALGATVVMFQVFHARQYAFAAVFGALVLLYNPVAPVFSLSGGWLRVVVLASAVPFILSLVPPDVRPAHDD